MVHSAASCNVSCASYFAALPQNASLITALPDEAASVLLRYEAFAFRKYEAQASESACIRRNFQIIFRQSNRLAFLFSPPRITLQYSVLKKS